MVDSNWCDICKRFVVNHVEKDHPKHMKTKYGETSKRFYDLLVNEGGFSVIDIEQYRFDTMNEAINSKRAAAVASYLKRKAELNKEGLVTVHNGFYSIARKKDGDSAFNEYLRRIGLSKGHLDSVIRIQQQVLAYPKLSPGVKIAVLEVENKAQALKIVLFENERK